MGRVITEVGGVTRFDPDNLLQVASMKQGVYRIEGFSVVNFINFQSVGGEGVRLIAVLARLITSYFVT